MTYDWNKQVEITVPTGTNGWIYSGEVIINGVKVRFPVGVPTTVPEPAAALLNKMIELEREEENNTAKPDNHYVGSVTVPEGKTLTLAKGAKVVDEDGLLGSTPAPVVILPETEMSLTDGPYLFTTPWAVEIVAGGVYVVTYNGVEYECEAYDSPEEPGILTVMGNSEFLASMGIAGGNPDAPFYLLCLSNAAGAAEGAYGQLMTDGNSASVSLSIVQTGGASADSGSSGSTEVYTVTATGSTTGGLQVSDVSKSFDEILTAAKAGYIVRLLLAINVGYFVLPLTAYTDTTIVFFGYPTAGMSYQVTGTADGFTGELGP